MPWLLSVLAPALFTLVVGSAPAVSLERVATRGLEPAPSATSSAGRLQRGYLRVEGLERAALVDALGLRVPHLAFEPFEAAAGAEVHEGVAFVELRRLPGLDAAGDVAFALTIVVSDGRAFDRRVSVGPDDRETVRLLASTVANLLLAVEAGSVVADRGDVPLPVAAPAAACACECPAAPACPVATPDHGPREPLSPAPRVELGPSLALVTVLGLGAPASADRFAAAGVGVGVHARLRRGAFFIAELRTAGRGEAAGNRLVRQRVALGAGYQLRRGAWSLDASLSGTLEPWWFRGAPIDPAPRPLWGVVARLAPSLRHAHLGGGPMGLTLGPVIELGTSAQLTDGSARIGLVTVDDGRSVLSRTRVGGLELATGLAATLWFGVPR